MLQDPTPLVKLETEQSVLLLASLKSTVPVDAVGLIFAVSVTAFPALGEDE